MMLERYPNLKEEVGGSIPDCEISSLHDGKLSRWLIASCALALPCRSSISKKEKKEEGWGKLISLPSPPLALDR
jgi:hypothetical protein